MDNEKKGFRLNEILKEKKKLNKQFIEKLNCNPKFTDFKKNITNFENQTRRNLSNPVKMMNKIQNSQVENIVISKAPTVYLEELSYSDNGNIFEK